MGSRAKAGFTMIELLVSVVIMVFLAIGMGAGMDSGSKVHRDASFETDSAMLADTLNSALGDLFRYSKDIRKNTDVFQDSLGNQHNHYYVPFVFTNLEYGVQDGYLTMDTDADGKIQIRNLKNSDCFYLVNAGAYSNLRITDFHLDYVSPTEDTGGNTGYVVASYVIHNANNTLSKEISTVIRFMN